MGNNNKKFFEEIICSLNEVEQFLNKYNTFSDALSILKILKHRKNYHKKNK